MAKKKSKQRGSKSTSKTQALKVVEHHYKGMLSLIIPLYNEVERLPLLRRALERFEKAWTLPYEVVLVNDGSKDETAAQLQAQYVTALTERTDINYVILDLTENQGKGKALQKGVEAATGDHLLTIDADMATTPETLLQWLPLLEGRTFNDQQILIGSREHPQSKVKTDGSKRRFLGGLFNIWVEFLTGSNSRDTQCGCKLYPKAIGKWLFANMISKGWAHDVELLHKAGMYDIEVVEMPIKWQEVADSKVNVLPDGIKMGFATMGLVLSSWMQFFWIHPFKEMQQGLKLNHNQESPLYRFLFALLATCLVILMPAISFDYGITGDEYVQKVYGEYVLNFFESDGVDDRALTYQNLYLYGGLFDYLMAWLHKYCFSSWDVYEMRHFFNALLGAFLMIFTGLLAKTTSQRWQVGFWALLFVAVSPRIFGHSMNNPKDIPFAFGYIFTLYHIINFVRHLPKPSAQAFFGIIVGVSISINVRVGGILLIPYLFLFTGGAYVVEKHLDLKNVKQWLKLGVGLLVIALLGYLGGSLFWPFAKEDPINSPQVALAEMSNFAIGIRMIWQGEHYWSDFLPPHYILHWFSIATPVLILIGSLFSVVPILKDARNRWLFLMVIFTGIFPVVYAIIKDSALYDGMRHFLFVYPILTIMAAYGIVYTVERFNKTTITAAVSVLLILGLYSPLRWMVVSHPNQYTYFNELFGGIQNAYNKYETDYWMNSTKEASQWIMDNLPEVKEGRLVKIATQAHKPVNHYFSNNDSVQVTYTRYHERIKQDWDYGLYISRYVNVGIIESGLFPPGEEVLAKREIDGVLIWAITRRSEINKAAHEADDAMAAGDAPRALALLEAAVKDNPKDESAWLLLAQYYLQTQQLPKAKAALDQLLEYSDRYSNTLGLMAKYYFATKDIKNGKSYLEKATEVNIKYVYGHYQLAQLYAQEGRLDEALRRLELFDRYGGATPRNAGAYDFCIQVAQQLRNDAARLFFEAKKLSLQGNWQQALPKLNQSLAINSDYAPALYMKNMYDKEVQKQQLLQTRRARLKQEGKLK